MVIFLCTVLNFNNLFIKSIVAQIDLMIVMIFCGKYNEHNVSYYISKYMIRKVAIRILS